MPYPQISQKDADLSKCDGQTYSIIGVAMDVAFRLHGALLVSFGVRSLQYKRLVSLLRESAPSADRSISGGRA